MSDETPSYQSPDPVSDEERQTAMNQWNPTHICGGQLQVMWITRFKNRVVIWGRCLKCGMASYQGVLVRENTDDSS